MSMFYIYKRILLLILLFFIITLCQSYKLFALDPVNPVIIDEKTQELSLGKYIEVIEDKKKVYSIKEVLSDEFSEKFIKSKRDLPFFYLSSSAFWIRFKVTNNLEDEFQWYLEIPNSIINNISIYVKDQYGSFVDEKKSGSKFPFEKREIKHRYFMFNFEIPPLESNIYYIRIQTDCLINLSFSMIPKSEFIERNVNEQIFLGIYFGAIIVMIIYNLLTFFSINDKSHLYFVLYYIAYLFLNLQLYGLSFQFIWPDLTWWAAINLPVFMFICSAMILQFSRSFLEMKNNFRMLNRTFKILMIISFSTVPFVFIFNYGVIIRIGILVMVVSFLLVTAGIIRSMKTGFKPARFFLLAWIFLFINSILFIFKSLSIIPDDFFTSLGIQSASLLEIVTITLGLTDRINFMKIKSDARSSNLEIIVERRTEELNKALLEMGVKEKNVQQELELAADIQKGILPKTPISYRGINVISYYSAMGTVSGDFFDIFEMNAGYYGILIADASGHGMPAAFITAMAKINFSEAIQRHIFPTEIIKQVNCEMVKVIKTDDFLTAFFLVISPTYEVFYCNASHMLPMVMRSKDQSIERWDTNGLFIGALAEANEMYEEKSNHLYYGDRVLLFTDGISESRNIKDELFGEGRLQRSFVNNAEYPLEIAKENMISEWRNFVKGVEQSDDVTLVMIEIDPVYKNLDKHREAGFKLLTRGHLEEAIIELKNALGIDKNDEKTHLYIGECYLKYKNYRMAVEHLNKYLVNNDIDANVWFHLSQAYYNLGNYLMANESALKAAQLRTDSADVLIISGLSLRDLGQYEEAAKIWERLLIIEPNNELAKMELQRLKEIKDI